MRERLLAMRMDSRLVIASLLVALLPTHARSGELEAADFDKFKGLLQIGAVYSTPLQDYYDGIEGGVGFVTTAVVPLTRRLALRLSAAETGQQWDPDSVLVPLDPAESYDSQNIGFNSWRFSGGLQAYKYVGGNSGRTTMFYAFSVVSVWKGTQTIDLEVSRNGVPIGAIDSSDTRTRVTNGFGAGMIQMLGGNLGLDLSFEFERHVYGEDDSREVDGVNIEFAIPSDFNLQFGIVFLLQ